MKKDSLYVCPKCRNPLQHVSESFSCFHCQKRYEIKHEIPLFGEDRYWGKIQESELQDMIAQIEQNGFEVFTPDMQRKLDFTYDEDRADWRFYVPLSKDSVVLDIGSGLGRISIPLARVAKRVISCDLSLSRMRFLKQRAKSEELDNVDVFVGDVFDLPLKEESFDLIVMNGVLEWVGLTDTFDNPRAAQLKSLEACKRLLKKGGKLYIGIENRMALVYLKAQDHGGLRYTSYMPRFIANWYSKVRGHGPYKTYTYSKRGYEKLFKDAGFVQKPKLYLPYPGYNLPRIIIPFESISGLQYVIRTFKKPKGRFKKIFFNVVNNSFFIRVYRHFFYSFGMILIND